ncbi:MAG TPA: hypothetical protein VES59_01370, partial [Bacteroidota bacterium]|nr:hypothetical protein [Bacteroidota bacterium]
MIVTSLVGHLLELNESIDRSSDPADQIASSFFRRKHYLGARDRRFISEKLFGMIRHRRFIEALLEEHVRRHPEDSRLDSLRARYLPLFVAYAVCVDSQPGQRVPDSGNPADNAANPGSLNGIDSLWMTYFPRSELSSFIQSLSGLQRLEFIQPDDRNIEEAAQLSP